MEIRMSHPCPGKTRLASARAHHCGFLDAATVAAVAGDPDTRLFPLLIRFGGFRAVVPANQVAGMIETVERGGDYCRDVSIPARYREHPHASEE